MSCIERGCRNLEWRCGDCNRVASTATMSDGWIPVTEKYPDVNSRVLAVDMNDPLQYVDELIYFGMYKDSHDWSSYHCNTFDPTHWRYYPELPKVK